MSRNFRSAFRRTIKLRVHFEQPRQPLVRRSAYTELALARCRVGRRMEIHF